MIAARRLDFEIGLAALTLLALLFRVAYVIAQPATDPAATGAVLDGAYYVQWGQALASGAAGPGGAYYLGPLYAWLLAGFFVIFGDQIVWLYLLQHVAVALTALLAALIARELAGERAGLSTAALVLLYHPLLFFASRPLGEPVALLLLMLALWLLMRPTAAAWSAAGFAVALSALARPNFLLVIGLWLVVGLVAVSRRRAPRDETTGSLMQHRARYALALAAIGLVLLPVAIRNFRASGHLVPVSANAGMTLYHGNGPGAKGIGVLPAGFSGRMAAQRREATYFASLQSGRPLDDVEADRWWGRQALQARIDDPRGTLLLMLRRTGLFLSNRELDLDYAPSIDANPWRRSAPLPYALLLALAVGGLCFAGFRRSGGWVVWGAIAACAAAPLLFYVSSRYRLPTALLLSIPAGVALAELWHARGKRRWVLAALIAGVALLSISMPVGDLARTAKAVALANRAVSWKRVGELERAEQDLRQALVIDSASAPAHFGLGVVLVRQGRSKEAETHYREALRIRPAGVEPAQNLSSLLIETGRPAEAIAVLEQALAIRPDHLGCWKNLIVAHYASGNAAAAERTVGRAGSAGLILDPGWLAEIARAYEEIRER